MRMPIPVASMLFALSVAPVAAMASDPPGPPHARVLPAGQPTTHRGNRHETTSHDHAVYTGDRGGGPLRLDPRPPRNPPSSRE